MKLTEMLTKMDNLHLFVAKRFRSVRNGRLNYIFTDLFGVDFTVGKEYFDDDMKDTIKNYSTVLIVIINL